jgi:hypothetical protein
MRLVRKYLYIRVPGSLGTAFGQMYPPAGAVFVDVLLSSVLLPFFAMPPLTTKRLFPWGKMYNLPNLILL